MLFAGHLYVCRPFILEQEFQHPCVEQRPGCGGTSQLVQHKGNGCPGWVFLVLQKEAAIVLYEVMPRWVNACQPSLVMLLLHYANCIIEAL